MSEPTPPVASSSAEAAKAQPPSKAPSSPRGDEPFKVAATAFLVLIVLMVNYLAFRHYERFDWTSQGMYTLSDKSRAVLKGLTQDVTVYVFMSQNEPSFADTDELLQRYKVASPHLLVQYVDPDREPAEFKILSQRFGVMQGVTELGESRADVAAVVVMGDKKWHVDRDDLVGFDLGRLPGEDTLEVNVKAEQSLTGALVQVMSGKPTHVCVTRGHGEYSLDDNEERSLSAVKMALRHDNLELSPFETLGKKEVPKECDAVLVLGPMRPFSEAEADLIVSYVQGGGRALLALDPVVEHDVITPSGFEAALEKLKVRLDRALAIELSQERLLSPNAVEFLATEFGDHETTRLLRGGARVLISLARSISITEASDSIDVLLRMSDQSFAATDITRIMSGQGAPTQGPSDLPGPVDLAVAVRVGEPESKQGGRMIVIGDSDFLQPALIDAPELQNFHLMSAFIGHLTEREALIEIPPKKVKGGVVMFTQEDLFGLLIRVAVLIPGAAFFAGIAMWLSRRS